MYRGTTPTNIFTSELDLSTADVLYITYKQLGKVLVEKTKSDVTFGDGTITVTLTQDDTLKFSEDKYVYVQIRARFADGSAVASNIIETPAQAILKDGVI